MSKPQHELINGLEAQDCSSNFLDLTNNISQKEKKMLI